jgi:hypothetical protein
MTRVFNRDPDVDPEFWQPAFARVAVFSFLLLAATLSIRRLSGLSAPLWARFLTAGPIVRDVQTSALAFLLLSALPAAWHVSRRGQDSGRIYRQIDYSRIFLLLGITLGVLGVVASLRIMATRIAAAYIPALDLAGGLLLPMVSGFTLVMFPDIALNRMRSAVKLLAVFCLLAVVGLRFASQMPPLHSTPKGTTETPRQRQIPHVPAMA